MTAQLQENEAIRRFVLAGNATFTLVSVGTGTRFTYRVRGVEMNPGMRTVPFFVELLNGSSNETDFGFLGTIFPAGLFRYVHGKKSKISKSAPSAKAFAWFWARIQFARSLSPDAEFWHEGKCGRCSRKLTVPESVASGLGPECSKS